MPLPSPQPQGDPTTRFLPLRPVEFFVLAALRTHPLHGYGLVTEIESLTEGRVRPRPGDLYRVLYRLEQRRLLIRDDTKAAEIDDERRTRYRLTELGERVARAEAELMARVAGNVLEPV